MQQFKAYVNGQLIKRTGPIRFTLLMMFFVLSFRTFQYFPGGAILREFWIIAVFAFIIIFYTINKMFTGLRFTYFEIYIIMLMVTVPIVSAVMANREFGQPLVYGILAQRKIVLAGCVMIFYHYVENGSISLGDLDQVFIWLAWGTLCVYMLITFLFDPLQYSSYGMGFVSGMYSGKPKFKFDNIFIVIGFMRYAFLGFWSRRSKYYLFALPFLAYMLFDGQRSLLLSLVISFIIIILRWGSFHRLVLWAPRLLVVIIFVIVCFFLADPSILYNLAGRFKDAISVVITREFTDDVSANARIIEISKVWPYIEKHWMLGNGDLSKQWRWGYQSIMGWLYPGDIGIIGVIYLHGFLGLSLFLIQFYFAFRYAKRLRSYFGEYRALINSLKGFMLFFAINSLITGRFANSVEIGLICVAILSVVPASVNKYETMPVKTETLSV